MFSNYVKLTFRNLLRNRFYSIINIFGLAVGILCGTLILLYIYDELSYDRHHKQHPNIYRLESSVRFADNAIKVSATPVFLGEALKEEYPEIKEAVRFRQIPVQRFRYGDKELPVGATQLADDTVFDIFTHTFLKGTPKEALDQPGDLVVTETFAERFFGDENPMGKTLLTDTGHPFQVSAVLADLPDNDSFGFEALASMASYEQLVGKEQADAERNAPESRFLPSLLTYVLTEKNATMQSVLDDFGRFQDKYLSNLSGGAIDMSYELMATALADVHFRTGLMSDQYGFGGSDILYIYIFAAVAVFLLLIAAINYMNMATAVSAKRAKEIGLRKVMGAVKGQIVGQFLTESTVISLAAMVISILAAEALLPVFNQLAGKQLTLLTSGKAALFLGIVGMSVAVGLVSGSYPAFHLSRFMPARVLKDSVKPGRKGGTLRKILVATQFAISIVMVIGTMLVFEQLNYLRDKDLGFDKENVLTVPVLDEMLLSSLGSFREEVLRSPVILDAAISSGVAGLNASKAVTMAEDRGEMTQQTFDLLYVDYDYLALMGIEIVNGRNFDRNMAADEAQGFIVNETVVKSMGWGDQALGKRLEPFVSTSEYISTQRFGQVIGVVGDFHIGSLRNPVSPMLIVLSTPPHRHRYGGAVFISMRIADGRTDEATRFVDKTRKAFGIQSPLQYVFLDQALRQFYLAEERMSTIFGYGAMICIILSFLGLLGLSSYMTQQRTKEIGIRKVLGASVPQLVSLLSERFIQLAIVANVLAWPVAYYAVSKWLQDYPYRIDIGILTFIAAGVLSLGVALGAVGFQAFKAASGDPIQSLRAE